MVRCPSTQSGPWNSASAAVIGKASSSVSRRPEWRKGCHHPRRSETKRNDPSASHSGWPTDSVAPPAIRCGAPTACSTSCWCAASATRPMGSSRIVEASQGMSGWFQATTARRSPLGCGRGVPKKSDPSRRVLSQGDSVRVEKATIRRTGRVDSSPWISRTASTQWPSAVTLSPPWLCTSPGGGAAPRANGAPPPLVAGALDPAQNHTRWSDWST